MNNLPDDLRAIEAKLSELVPSSSLDSDRLIFEAGYAAALRRRRFSKGPAQTLLTVAGSALAGIAATLLVMASWQGSNAGPEVEPIPVATEQLEPAAPTLPASAPQVAVRGRPNSAIAQLDLTGAAFQGHSIWIWRNRLLQDGSDWSDDLDTLPAAAPRQRSTKPSSHSQPTNLQWQRELIQDVSSSTRAST